jgi:hypothetical protein
VGTPPPATGVYAWLLKAEGATDHLKYGLSLIHPQDPATEVVIEPPNAAVTDSRLVATASVDTAALQSSPLEPYALVYIVGGDVRRVPLRADGTAPASRLQRANSSSACRFLLDAPDYAAPENSRFVVSTAGPDGDCASSADNGSAEVRLDPGHGLAFTPLVGAAPLAVLRDPATLAPRGWLFPAQVQLWSAAAGNPVLLAQPATRAVLASYRSALVETAHGLTVLDFGGSTTVTETALTGVTSTGWQGIGFDAQYYYAYRNAGSGASAGWSVLRISRNAPAATSLSTGAGQIAVASMGSDKLYLTVVGSATVELRRLLKAVPGAGQLLESGPLASSFCSVFTGSAGVHLLWRITGLGSAAPGYAIELVDESGTVLYASAAGGFSLGPADASRLDFRSSENRNRFLFVEGFGPRFYGDATLVAYDTATRSATRAGVLPGSAEFGADYVFANVVAGPVAPATGFATRSIGGVIQGAGTRVFSFDPAAANSLKNTTRQQ